MKIFLIRHGETTGDLEDRYGGSYDDHLTPHGLEQLNGTAKKLSGKGIELIFTSKLIRAKESANIIQKELLCPIEVVEGIQERDYGILTGLTKIEALAKYPDTVEAHKNSENTDPEGESLSTFQDRVMNAFFQLTKKKNNVLAVVSHGGPIKHILKSLNYSVPEKIGDGGVIEIEIH